MNIPDLIRERGPLTVAAFMELALYHPQSGYYANAAQRSGRAGDFFTSVDVGPLFGALLAAQIREMARFAQTEEPEDSDETPRFDLVEAGAGNARLSADILGALASRDPELYANIRLHLVEASGAARAAQRTMLAEHAARLVSSSAQLPDAFTGVLIANELLDAFPVHQVVMRGGRLREVYVRVDRGGRLFLREGDLSTPALAAYFDRLGVTLAEGWRAEVNLQAVDWIRAAVQRLQRGFIILLDYGHEARDLYSVSHSAGTLMTFSRHQASGGDEGWLENPGSQDITAHVDFTSIREAAEAEGATVIGLLDQTYFLMGLLTAGRTGADTVPDLFVAGDRQERLALKTLLMPGGLGSTMKVLILGKDVGKPPLAGISYRVRLT
ncbi:MAG TPA: SAM-dependent methyltransferase [Vicinamibacterales bacterium]